MKITIEIEQESAECVPVTKVFINGELVGPLLQVELDVDASKTLPKLMLKFVDLDKPGAVLSGGEDFIRTAVATSKKSLRSFSWVEVATISSMVVFTLTLVAISHVSPLLF